VLRECVINTLEGPGINKSECPVCRQPLWKKDLAKDHQYAALAEAVQPLAIQTTPDDPLQLGVL
jgi:hypothetical protein